MTLAKEQQSFDMSMRVIPLLVLGLSTAAALAQSHRASVRGVVVNSTGAPVSGVRLLITSAETGDLRSAVTDAGGRFAVAMLPPGSYRIHVENPGYKKYVVQTELQVNQDLWLRVPLTLGEVTEEIMVTAPLIPLDTESAGLGAVIDRRQLGGLPLDRRNFLELSLLVPGAAPAPEGSASSLRGDFAFTVNGDVNCLIFPHKV